MINSFRAAWPRALQRVRQTALAALSVAVGVAALGVAQPARAEGQIRVAEQFGVVYLLLNVARDQHLIELEGRREGLDIKVGRMNEGLGS